MDMNQDDFAEGDPVNEWQELVIKANHRIAVSYS